MRRVDRPIGNQSGSISCLSTIGNSNRLDFSDSRVGSRLWRTKEAKVVNRVQGNKSGVTGLVHETSNVRQEWRWRVGCSVWEGSDDAGGILR